MDTPGRFLVEAVPGYEHALNSEQITTYQCVTLDGAQKWVMLTCRHNDPSPLFRAGPVAIPTGPARLQTTLEMTGGSGALTA